jgi:hypothetical protein
MLRQVFDEDFEGFIKFCNLEEQMTGVLSV